MAYEYINCEAIHVRDGDTCTIKFDLGFKITFTDGVRMAHMNAPELKHKDGARAKARFQELLSRTPLTVRTSKFVTDKYRDKTEKYGRYLAQIFNADGVNIGEKMIEEGLATPYEGGRRAPKPTTAKPKPKSSKKKTTVKSKK